MLGSPAEGALTEVSNVSVLRKSFFFAYNVCLNVTNNFRFY